MAVYGLCCRQASCVRSVCRAASTESDNAALACCRLIERIVAPVPAYSRVRHVPLRDNAAAAGVPPAPPAPPAPSKPATLACSRCTHSDFRPSPCVYRVCAAPTGRPLNRCWTISATELFSYRSVLCLNSCVSLYFFCVSFTSLLELHKFLLIHVCATTTTK